MTTFTLFNPGPYSIPGGTSWYLADLGEFRGKQELYTKQSPQRLKTLREHALIESAVSSNRMEGVNYILSIIKSAYQEFSHPVEPGSGPPCLKIPDRRI